MARRALWSPKASASPAGLAPPALLLLLVVALVKGDSSPSAADTDGGGGFGAFLRRLMFDFLAWLGSLFGLNQSPGGGDGSSGVSDTGDDDDDGYRRGGAGRFPHRAQGLSTASPEDVETIGGEDVAGLTGNGAGRRSEFSDSSEEREKSGNAAGDPNASPEGAANPAAGAGSAELLDGVAEGRALRDASAEQTARRQEGVPAGLARATA